MLMLSLCLVSVCLGWFGFVCSFFHRDVTLVDFIITDLGGTRNTEVCHLVCFCGCEGTAYRLVSSGTNALYNYMEIRNKLDKDKRFIN